MRQLIRSALGVMLFVGLALAAHAQTYPVNNPAYLPNGILSGQTLTAPGNAVYVNNGNGTLYLRVANTFTGLVGTVQVTESRGASPSWSTVSVQNLSTGTRQTSIIAAGLYRLNVAGAAQVRFNLSAISTGQVDFTWSGGNGQQFGVTLPATRATYGAAIQGLATAASATDFLTITGATGVVTRVTYVECSGVAGTAGTASIVGLKRSTANSAGTSTTPTAVPVDAGSAAAGSTVRAYTANPTTGTLVGNVRAGKVGLPLATAGTGNVLRWTFGDRPSAQEIVLRAATEVFALNGAGATLAATAALDCGIEWTEGE